MKATVEKTSSIESLQQQISELQTQLRQLTEDITQTQQNHDEILQNLELQRNTKAQLQRSTELLQSQLEAAKKEEMFTAAQKRVRGLATEINQQSLALKQALTELLDLHPNLDTKKGFSRHPRDFISDLPVAIVRPGVDFVDLSKRSNAFQTLRTHGDFTGKNVHLQQLLVGEKTCGVVVDETMVSLLSD